MFIIRRSIAITVMMLTIGLTQVGASEPLKVLVMGDSMMAAHRISNRAVSDVIEKSINVRVTDTSTMGARLLYKLPISGSMGLNISKQYRAKNWDWVVLNGGGNDLWMGCGCNRCDRKMNKLISESGRKGEIPRLISKIRNNGAHVIYVGYLRSPGVGSPIEHCRDEGDELERRIDHLSDQWNGVYFVSLADMVPFGDRSFHGIDMIHPSRKASREIGIRVARAILRAEQGR